MASEVENPVIPKGTLVDISGLQSANGKKLNGGSGIIVGYPTEEASGAIRYPVQVYALFNEATNEVKEVTTLGEKKALKIQNLTVKKDQRSVVFDNAAMYSCTTFQQSTSTREKDEILFLLKTAIEKGTPNYGIKLTYANMLRHYKNQPEEALELLKATVPTLPKNFPNYDNVCYDIAVAIAQTNSNDLESALEWALKIPIDSTQMDVVAQNEALDAVRLAATKRCQNSKQDPDGKTSQLLLRTVKEMLKREPNNKNHIHSLASAQCLSGNNVEGTKIYRKAIELYKKDGEPIPDGLTRGCCLAQMQCPGMPMENLEVLNSVNGKWMCVEKDQLGDFEYYSNFGEGGHVGIMPTSQSGLTMKHIPMVSDPNDPKVFGELIAKLEAAEL